MTGLWSFSLAFYARPSVALACLQCQDQAGADVNLVLFLLWQHAAGFSAEEVAAIDREVRVWREQAVQPLRAVRRYLKGKDAETFRNAVKAVELEAERLEQNSLSRHARPDRNGTARANLEAYETVLGRKLPPDAVSALLSALE